MATDLTAVDQPEIFRDMREFRGQRGLRQIDDADEFLAPAPLRELHGKH